MHSSIKQLTNYHFSFSFQFSTLMSEKRPSKSEVPASEKAVEFQLPAGWKRDEVQGLRGISLPRTRYIGYI